MEEFESDSDGPRAETLWKKHNDALLAVSVTSLKMGGRKTVSYHVSGLAEQCAAKSEAGLAAHSMYHWSFVQRRITVTAHILSSDDRRRTACVQGELSICGSAYADRSSEVNRGFGFVVSGLWIVNWKHD